MYSTIYGRNDAREIIESELTRVGIPIEQYAACRGDITPSVVGKLAGLTFVRGSSYYHVEGFIPLDIAEELHNHPLNSEIRINGSCVPVIPREVCRWFDDAGYELILPVTQMQFDDFNTGKSFDQRFHYERNYRVVTDPTAVGNGFIDKYHVDSELALNVFVTKICEHAMQPFYPRAFPLRGSAVKNKVS